MPHRIAINFPAVNFKTTKDVAGAHVENVEDTSSVNVLEKNQKVKNEITKNGFIITLLKNLINDFQFYLDVNFINIKALILTLLEKYFTGLIMAKPVFWYYDVAV